MEKIKLLATGKAARNLRNWNTLSYSMFALLHCPGVPLPSLTWYKNEESLDDMYFAVPENRTVMNKLHISNASRDLLNTVLVCRAENLLYSASFNVSATVDLNRK